MRIRLYCLINGKFSAGVPDSGIYKYVVTVEARSKKQYIEFTEKGKRTFTGKEAHELFKMEERQLQYE